LKRRGPEQAPSRGVSSGAGASDDADVLRFLALPAGSARLGGVMAGGCWRTAPEVVLTVETKGIPLAVMVARAMGIRMVMARREGRVT